MKFSKKIDKTLDKYFWNVLIVDDDEEVHVITKLVLKDFSYKNKKIKFYDAYNTKETKEVLNLDIDFSIILLDIIMETDDAGLLLTKYIREELKNKLIRIILRTGQPGSAPEEKVIIDYDINDYKEKTELTSIKLTSSLVSSLRSYEELKNIREHKDILVKKVEKNVVELRKKDKLIQYQNRISQNTKLLDMLAHQWRQPLNIISINANNLLLDIELNNIDKEVFKTTSKNIVSTTQSLSKQIDNFLSHYEPSSEKSNVSLGELFDRIMILTKERVEKNNILIEKDVNTDYIFNTHKSELEQIIVHLIDNSIDAYLLNDHLERIIKIKTENIDDELKITIEDSAGGLTEDIKDKIFIPYFSTKDKFNDTGLGLYMSKLLVEEHLSGELNIFNKDKGCTVELIFYLNNI